MSRNNRSHTGLKVFLILVILVLIAGTAFMIKLSLDLVDQVPETRPADTTITLPVPEKTEPTETEAPTETTMPEPEKVVATASISAQGDLLMHKMLFDTNSLCHQSDGSYDFSSIFQYLTDTLKTYDYSIANLETTFGGDDFPYQGNPSFNCPDPFINSVADAGYDLLLTANNHSYDTLMTGITRTLETVRGAGLQTLGTRLSEDELRYSILEINGIKIGMVCYTYTSGLSNAGKPRLNGNTPVENPELVNWYSNTKPQKLYDEMEVILADMKENGADATMLFIHWGNEYELKQNSHQQKQAQALCDLGVDVIVGGHPHVMQPVEVLTSTSDPEHNTLCIYSMGNAVSNQRKENIPQCGTAHVEDGILFSITFEKYSDGAVYIAEADILPTWCNKHNSDGGMEYNILPLFKDTEDQWQENYNLTDDQFTACQKSWDRTMAIVGEGLTRMQEFLAQEKSDRETYYLELVSNPAA